MKKRYLLIAILALALFGGQAQASGGIWPFKKKAAKEQPADTVKKKTPYDKLFEKGDSLSRGLLNVHLMKGKVYFEVPDSLLGRIFVMGSTVKATSDNTNGVVGSKDDLIPFTFAMADSSILVREVNFDITSGEKDILDAIAKSNIGAIKRKFKVEATSPEGYSVINVTDWFMDDDEQMRPLLGLSSNSSSYTRNQSYKKDLSYIESVKSFEDNLSVTSCMSYAYSLTNPTSGRQVAKDVPFTALVTRSILLLPERPYHPRTADARMNFFFTGRTRMGSGSEGSRPEYFANRWRLEPSDTAAFRRGEKVEPVKPIVYYIDSDFPEWWKPYIFKAVEAWNLPFENIGFKNAVKALPFPKDDPSFDPDNIRFSCIRYAPIGIKNAMGPSWVDPRSGEIINASVYVYHDVIKLISNWMFAQTAQANPNVRTADIPRELLGDALEYVIRHEVGHTLGLMHNMSASSVIPTEKLRDAAFTQKQGTTTSIMDYARFNYVAQPGDWEKGVKLTPPDFGQNDLWAIRWGYTPVFDAPDFEAETRITTQWITDSLKAAPFYRYGKQQVYGDGGIFFDPRNQTEDLGDDVIASTKYGVSNLKYILPRYLDWISDASDPDYSLRSELYTTILNQYLRYCLHVRNNIGGLYRDEVIAGDGNKPYVNVPRAKQLAAMDYLLELFNDTAWLDDPAVIGRLPIIGSPARNLEEVLLQFIFSVPFSAMRVDGVDTKEYSSAEALDAIFDFAFKPSRAGRALSEKQRFVQKKWVDFMMNTGMFKTPAASMARGVAGLSEASGMPAHSHSMHSCGLAGGQDASMPGEFVYDPVSGFEWVPRYVMAVGDISQGVIYGQLMKAYDVIKAAKAGAKADDKAHYELLMGTIAYSLK